MDWTPERKKEVQSLLRATARHLAAKERGEDSQLGYAKVGHIDQFGDVKVWKDLGPITFTIKGVLK